MRDHMKLQRDRGFLEAEVLRLQDSQTIIEGKFEELNHLYNLIKAEKE